jgi:sugar phosphate isomerase/epimerase
VGHIDFRPTLQTLKDINFDGYLTFELLPAASNPFAMMARGGHLEFLDPYTEKAINEMKKLEQELWPNE